MAKPWVRSQVWTLAEAGIGYSETGFVRLLWIISQRDCLRRYGIYELNLYEILHSGYITGDPEVTPKRVALFHPAIPRPFLLWIHSIVFASWVVFYILQSALVRTHNVKVHRSVGWFGVALAAAMVPLGFAIAVIMGPSTSTCSTSPIRTHFLVFRSVT